MGHDNPEARASVRAVLIDNDAGSLGWSGSGAHEKLGRIAGLDDALDAIARDAAESAEVRFKAFEARHARGHAPASDSEKQEAAGVYLAALREMEDHDAFGFPGLAPSGAGKQVVSWGTIVLRQLIALADDGKLLRYEGSEEPTVAEMRGYRVKDLVGVWLGAMTGTKVDVDVDDPSTRDKSIAAAVDAARKLIN